MDYPEPVLKDPSNKRVLPTAATVADPDLANHMAVFHTFNRNSIAKVLLPHVDMAAAEAVWSAVGLWDGEKRYPSDTGEIPLPLSHLYCHNLEASIISPHAAFRRAHSQANGRHAPDTSL